LLAAAGQPAVVERHARELGRLASAATAEEFVSLNDTEALSVFTRIREFPKLILEAEPAAAIFRISAVPGAMAPLLGTLRALAAQNGLDFAALARASGILYAAFLPGEGSAKPSAPLAVAIPEVFRACGVPEVRASAMLEWCPAEIKTSPDVVWGAPRPDFALMGRVKHSFDPQNILAPGRFAEGI
jgi:hypothetical protein